MSDILSFEEGFALPTLLTLIRFPSLPSLASIVSLFCSTAVFGLYTYGYQGGLNSESLESRSEAFDEFISSGAASLK